MAKNEPLVTFVILGWNNKKLLDECFESIYKQTYKNVSIVYVDSGSKDDSVEHVKKQHSQVDIFDAKENLGFAIGNNHGIARALKNKACRYVALLNTDARIAEDWLSQLVSFAQTHPHGAGFQSPTYDYYNHKYLDSFGITVDHYGRAVQLGHRHKGPVPETRPVFGVNAAAAMFSRSFLDAQPFGDDYFDSGMWMYLEDVDLAARATVMGWQNWYVNKSAAYHMGSATSKKNPGFSIYMVYRNGLPMLIKNFPLGILLRIAPRLIFSDIQNALNLLRHRNYKALKYFVRGRLRSFLMLRRFFTKRRQLKKSWVLPNAELWRIMKP
jgi:GT2 family glycosyltransferase